MAHGYKAMLRDIEDSSVQPRLLWIIYHTLSGGALGNTTLHWHPTHTRTILLSRWTPVLSKCMNPRGLGRIIIHSLTCVWPFLGTKWGQLSDTALIERAKYAREYTVCEWIYGHRQRISIHAETPCNFILRPFAVSTLLIPDAQTTFEQYHENAPAFQIGGTRVDVEHVSHNQEAYYYQEIYVNNNNPTAVCRLLTSWTRPHTDRSA